MIRNRGDGFPARGRDGTARGKRLVAVCALLGAAAGFTMSLLGAAAVDAGSFGLALAAAALKLLPAAGDGGRRAEGADGDGSSGRSPGGPTDSAADADARRRGDGADRPGAVPEQRGEPGPADGG
ncbi:hypothetical protein [Streptomyces tagetis]|uniref:Uncharacterized protein n=1 Tax=Streptomyces tagetis TaxID=2820809 RepID=A0A940XBN9_9ACTN|nr:hypothetical protein [Streptomyces sp. RG38]MBQ0825604.1 hypothetical protein [Streptomyces sp. RG38]